MSNKIKPSTFWSGFWSGFASAFDLFGAFNREESKRLGQLRMKNMLTSLKLQNRPHDGLMQDIERLAKDVDKLEQDSRKAGKNFGAARPLHIAKDKND